MVSIFLTKSAQTIIAILNERIPNPMINSQSVKDDESDKGEEIESFFSYYDVESSQRSHALCKYILGYFNNTIFTSNYAHHFIADCVTDKDSNRSTLKYEKDTLIHQHRKRWDSSFRKLSDNQE